MEQKESDLMKKTAIFIPAGGLGTRLSPLTDNHPKPCLPIYLDEQGNVRRLVELQVTHCHRQHAMAYVYIKYFKDQFDFLRGRKDVTLINTEGCTSYEVHRQAISELIEMGYENSLLLPSDEIIPAHVVTALLGTVELPDVNAVILCTHHSISKTIHYRDQYNLLTNKAGDPCYDMGIYLSKLAWDTRRNSPIDPKVKELNIWREIYGEGREDGSSPEPGVRLCIPDESLKHIDAGTPAPYYEALMKFNNNRLDGNGNLVFPGAVIHPDTRDSVALPNSDSRSVALDRAIIPEGACIHSPSEALSIPLCNTEYFGNLDIEDYLE